MISVTVAWMCVHGSFVHVYDCSHVWACVCADACAHVCVCVCMVHLCMCSHVCGHGYVQMHVHMCVFLCACFDSSVFLSSSLSYILRQGILLNPELAILAS